MSMGLRSPNMARVACLLVGLVVLSCAADGASRGHLFGAGARRSLIDTTTNRKVFNVLDFGAKPEASGGSAPSARKAFELPGGGSLDDLPQLPTAGGSKGGKDDGGGSDEKDDGPNPDGDDNDTGMAFIRTWVAACRGDYKGPAKVLIPEGTFLTAQVVFQGPCTSSNEPIVVEIQGNVKASTDLSQYPSPEWISFENVDGLIVTGKGVINGQGEKTWRIGEASTKDSDTPQSPSSLKFMRVKNALVEGITSLNSKFFHYHIYDCHNLTLNNVAITAPDESPNTDGVHISTSDHISVTNSIIGTGDDCVSIGGGTSEITVQNVTCGPGHGISIGSLGKYKDEKPVSGVSVSNCILKNTTNGARIKTWAGVNPGTASNIVFEDITLDHVKNPIIIDQNYGGKKGSTKQSMWKISDVHFRRIKGTASNPVAISLQCSSSNPCQGVELADIDISYGGARPQKGGGITSSCANAKITRSGTINPPAPSC